MIGIEEVLILHDTLIRNFGGASGIRDQDLLESALARPYQTFDGLDLYPQPVDKASAILESIVKNHPFIDGNKRTGYVLMRLVLMHHGQDIHASEDEKYDFVIQVASGQMDFDSIKDWIQKKLNT